MKHVIARCSGALIAFAPALAWAQDTTEQPPKKEPGLLDAFGGFGDTMRDRLPSFIIAFIILALSLFLAKLASFLAQRALEKSATHRTAFAIVSKSAYIGTLVIGLTLSLKIAGLDISFIVGAATFGLGFAMKDILENYISGVIIVLQEPFHVGDMVEIDGNLGWVEEIEARVTKVKSVEGHRIIFPNSHMISGALTNYTTFPERRLTVKVGVSYDTDLPKLIEIVKGVLENDEEVLKKPAPLVLFQEFGDSSLDLVVKFWIDQTVSHWLKVPSKISIKLKKAFDAADINIPYPVTTLSVNEHDSGDVLRVLGAKTDARADAEARVREGLSR